MNHKKAIIETIQALSGKYSPYVIFSDWVTVTAISIQNLCSLRWSPGWEEREKRYMETMAKYSEAERQQFPEMTGNLVAAFECGITDYLGEIYMESGSGNKNTGQFFTPYHVSKMTAQIALRDYKDGDKCELNEPSCGGGGMMIAAADELHRRGVNYQSVMKVVAQDLDWMGVYMTYVQLSLMGIDAIVVQGDTLQSSSWQDRPPGCILRSPRNMGVLM